MSNAIQEHVEKTRTAIAAGEGRLDPEAVSHAKAVLARVDRRFEVAPHHTVIALAGATGSGKSSLTNRLTGMEVAKIGARRPTTSQPLAIDWSSAPAALMTWLDVPRQHRVNRSSPLAAPDPDALDDVVLIDLPDHDSTELAHRKIVDEVLTKVDMVIWVVDPQKYADELLHTRYLTPMQGHQSVMVVVLNQVDKLSDQDIDVVTGDLRSLLDRQGLTEVPIVPTSATTGAGISDLRTVIREASGRRSMMVERFSADLLRVQNQLAEGVGASEVELQSVDAASQLVAALSDAAGVNAVGEAVSHHYVRSAGKWVRWPFVAWMTRFSSNPLKQARLEGQLGVSPGVLVSALPPPSTAAKAQVELAHRSLLDAAAQGLPRPWQQALRNAATPSDDDLADALDQAVMHTDLTYVRPWWWKAVAVFQWLFALLLVAGLVLTLAQGVMSWFSFSLLGDINIGSLPVAGAMVLLGLAAGLLLSTAAAIWVRMSARALRESIENELTEKVRAVAHSCVLAGAEEVLHDHRRVRLALSRTPGT